MSERWRNWAGDQVCTPAEIARPATRAELASAVVAAAAAGRTVRVAGAGHSFGDAVLTDGVLILPQRLDRVLDVDRASGRVRVEAGITIAALSEALHTHGLAMANLGDIDRQTIAGAISTATHGTGAALQNISAQVAALELVTASGDTVACDSSRNADIFDAARVGIGALGAIATVTVNTVPAFALHRVDEPRRLEDVLAEVDVLAAENDHFEFFVFPYTEDALTIRRNRTAEPLRPRSALNVLLNERLLQNTIGELLFRATRRFHRLIPHVTGFAARMLSEGDYVDRSFRIFSSERSIRFTEMEYALPRAAGPEAVRRILAWIAAQRYPVAFPLEYRVVAADDALLSPSHARETTYIAVHQYRGMEWRPYFDAVEGIMADYGGRPHWGKRHSLTSAELAGRYPRFDEFRRVRERLDPRRVFANDYVRRCLGD